MTFQNRYGLADRILHHVAFSMGPALTSIAEIEELIFRDRIRDISIERPTFVTALPRAGTTAMLNVLVGTGAFASHTYRDMPFVLCPMLWHTLSGRFQKSFAAQERAHGDGIEISSDSPEAFEEMIWKLFWPGHYKQDRIEAWQDCDDPEFVSFLTNHMRKIIALRRSDESRGLRYVSKNNLNIARIEVLRAIFPDCVIVLPFRDPVQHAASLLNQHVRFLNLHQDDSFTMRYMACIGHHDFGANLLPVNFEGWLKSDRRADATRLEFWLEYWIAAYGHILSREANGNTHVVSYDSMMANAPDGLAWLASAVDLDEPDTLIEQEASVHSPRTHDVDTSSVSPSIVEAAKELHRSLCEKSAV